MFNWQALQSFQIRRGGQTNSSKQKRTRGEPHRRRLAGFAPAQAMHQAASKGYNKMVIFANCRYSSAVIEGSDNNSWNCLVMTEDIPHWKM